MSTHHDQIQRAAYYLYLHTGCTDAEKNWHAAELEVRRRKEAQQRRREEAQQRRREEAQQRRREEAQRRRWD